MEFQTIQVLSLEIKENMIYLNNLCTTILNAICQIINFFLGERACRFNLYKGNIDYYKECHFNAN